MDNNAINLALQTSGIYGPNPYLTNQGRIPATTYRGTPTDAYGKPIQPTPGMTLNSTPAAPAPAPAAAPAGPQFPAALANNQFLTPGQKQAAWNATQPQGIVGYQGEISRGSGGFNPIYGPMQSGLGQGGPAAPTQAAAPPDTSYQNALDLLSNPGRVETPGATVPQSQPVSSQPSVLDQFLAGQRGGTGAAGYSNQGFFDVLNRLRGNAPTGGASQLQSSPSSPRDMGGMQMGNLPGGPPAGTAATPQDFATRGYLDENGVPNGPLMTGARQGFGAAQRRLT